MMTILITKLLTTINTSTGSVCIRILHQYFIITKPKQLKPDCIFCPSQQTVSVWLPFV